jgi:hypothetical protein
MTATQSTTVARTLAHGGRWFLFLIVAIQLLVFAVLVVINAAASDPIRDTVWEWPGVVWIRYPMIGAGAGLATATLVPFLANGVTRREYLRGAGMYATAAVALLSVIGLAAYLLERAFYDLGDRDVELGSQSPLHLFATYALLLSAYVVIGALIASGYARWSPHRATLMLVPFLLPMAAAETLLGTWWSSVAIPEDEPPLRLSLAVGGPAVAAVVLLAAAVVWLLLRDVAVRPKKG